MMIKYLPPPRLWALVEAVGDGSLQTGSAVRGYARSCARNPPASAMLRM